MPITLLIRKANPEDDDPILQAAARMEAKIRQAFLDAVQSVRDQTTINQIAAALEKGDANRVIELLDVKARLENALGGGGLSANVASVRSALQETFAAGARAALEALPSKISIDTAFNLMNPEAVRFLDRYTFDLIREIGQQQRDAIQAIVVRAFKEGGHPYEQARSIRDVIGLTANQEAAVANYRNALESGSEKDLRAALSRILRDGRFDRSVLSSIRTGNSLSQTQIDKMVERYRSRFLDYRAKNIARTESLRASHKGQRELWRQAVEQGLMSPDAKRKWGVSGDDRTCPECLDLEDEERGLDEEFAPGVMEPPDPHPSCRCYLTLVASSLRLAA